MSRDIWTSGMLNAEIDHLLEKVAGLEDELAKVREVNADQAKRLGLYQQDTRQRMARE